MNMQAYFIKTRVEYLSGCQCLWGPTGQMMGRGLGHASHRAAAGGGEDFATHEPELQGLSISDIRRLVGSKCPWSPDLLGPLDTDIR